MLHSLTWLVWLASSLLFALLNRQPLHQILFCLSAGMVFHIASRRSPQAPSWRTFIKVGMFMWGITLLFNLLTSHAGEIELLRLPASWPMVGGPITLESLLFGAASGLNLFAILLLFAAFNVAVETHRLLRWIPVGLFQAGVVVSIALAFIPQMISGLQSIREAQRIRGHRFRGVRDLLPLFVPLLTTGLERSLTLAESMEARGFGGILSDPSLRMTILIRTLTLAGFVLVLPGAVVSTLISGGQGWGTAITVGGMCLLLVGLYLQGRQVKRTFYRMDRWHREDSLSVVLSVVSQGFIIAMWQLNRTALIYYPYPPLPIWPAFHPAVGLAAILLSTPAFLLVSSGAKREPR